MKKKEWFEHLKKWTIKEKPSVVYVKDKITVVLLLCV